MDRVFLLDFFLDFFGRGGGGCCLSLSGSCLPSFRGFSGFFYFFRVFLVCAGFFFRLFFRGFFRVFFHFSFLFSFFFPIFFQLFQGFCGLCSFSVYFSRLIRFSHFSFFFFLFNFFFFWFFQSNQFFACLICYHNLILQHNRRQLIEEISASAKLTLVSLILLTMEEHRHLKERNTSNGRKETAMKSENMLQFMVQLLPLETSNSVFLPSMKAPLGHFETELKPI